MSDSGTFYNGVLYIGAGALFTWFALLLNGTRTTVRRTERALSIRHHVANFHCRGCGRPLCLPAAARAHIETLPRSDPQWASMDQSEWTAHQRCADTAVWISVDCLRCGKQNVFDDEGTSVANVRATAD